MIRLRYAVDLSYQIDVPGADCLFNVQAAHTPQQLVVSEQLSLSPPLRPQSWLDPVLRNRLLRLQAPAGLLRLQYEATVDIQHHRAVPSSLRELPIAELPGSVLSYLYPSRYCESDRLHTMAVAQFGRLWQGHARVQAIQDWIRQRVRFASNSSVGTTTACDTLASGVGVCRDFAHVMIALCRALNIPARFATGLDYGADPALGPPDFHAYVEVYLSHRWYLFDPSGTAIPMGFVRIGTGRDAADVAFATLFGPVRSQAPLVNIQSVAGSDGRLDETPWHTPEALSTDAGQA